ncbi:MAG: TonB family protein [Prevotella sp.]|nr:TonB family protein [Prevotella sp.]
MKNLRLLLITFLCTVAVNAMAQKKFSVYGVGFYNQENLFDTCHDEGKRDFEFLPTGSNRWNARKYKSKLRNMSRALADMGTDVLPNVGCAIIGLSEVENAKALDDLTAEEPLRARGYKYILVEGPDMRGVDVALLYNPALFTPTDTTYHYYYKKDVKEETEEEAMDELRLSREEQALENSVRWDDVEVPDQQPKFPGGASRLVEWLNKSIRYPEAARAAEREGRVIVQFVVDKDGSVLSPKVLSGISPDIDAEALRVVGEMPKWEAGMKEGVPVRSKYTIPVTFSFAKVNLPLNVSHTRGFLTITGKLAGETVTIIVCHWPSRFSGSERREWAGQQVHKIVEDLLAKNPDNKVFVMGDLNDDPTNKSVTEGLRGKSEIKDVKDGDMYNPWYNILVKEGQGTLVYGGSWNLFDQILMTPNIIDREGKKDYSSLKYWKCQIFRRNYLFQTEGRYKGNPKRTHAGGVWLDGYSDHLPTIVYLVKEQK